MQCDIQVTKKMGLQLMGVCAARLFQCWGGCGLEPLHCEYEAAVGQEWGGNGVLMGGHISKIQTWQIGTHALTALFRAPNHPPSN